jgi:hypothetical protein
LFLNEFNSFNSYLLLKSNKSKTFYTMNKRREFIRNSLIAATGISLGKLLYPVRTFAAELGRAVADAALALLNPRVKIEEEVYKYVPADNGAGPMWCGGSTCLVRIGKRVFASGLETIPEMVPLNNCRYMLFERSRNGWKQVSIENKGRTREPSPLAAFYDGRLMLSANVSLAEPNVYSGPARPEILVFKSSDVQKPAERLLPGWSGTPKFTEHSYRSFASDGANGELILFQNIGDTHSTWTFLDSKGNWSAQGQLDWPWGADYERPEPIRVCYPNVTLKDRAVYFCGVSDIIEPKKAWREYKKQITGRDWDYDFRRLYYTWSDDITSGKFHPWTEIASREETCGWISPCDMWVAPDGAVHIMWSERAINESLREKFFPDAKQSNALNYAILKNGQVVTRRTLVLAEEGAKEKPGAARFQVLPDNRLIVIYFISGTDAEGKPFAENRMMELSADGVPGPSVKIPLKQAFSSFFTATIRAGSKPSTTIDMLGTLVGVRNSINYACIQL